jgi:hydroxyacylglutathione hydrolase
MKKLVSSVILFSFIEAATIAQMSAPQIEGKEVFKNEDIIFHQIDEHTWIGSGHFVG